MKKILSLALTSFLLLASCSVFGKLSETEYNNTVVDGINNTSIAIESSATLYNETIPDLVTEGSAIDTTEMNTSYVTAKDTLTEVEALLLLESRNIEQQNSVRTEIQTYQSAANNYLDIYEEMLDYYQNKVYVEDVTKVESYDESLHTSYTTFIQANNDLVEILESYVSSK